ncbi:U-scoloptoxin(01)-Cw1a isoform X4 [Rhipicephalus sanguineus]|nr:U-scoloptoxin(01)-Cw1a isoform X3 [Rhipicephalus sanguineus]XP_049268646.1 U-scoloptoxin(01)-Cw1a isoform X2 [Rhipicephalus sanguineus]XP_049268648.1 U-scoloptoxin(01)-Cw1a isoform X4 [Rhipicephalus sanguineus]
MCPRTSTMKAVALLILAAVVVAVPRSRRQAVSLPDGVELLLGRAANSNFQCTRDGYYADVETNCQVFHVCRGVTKEDGNVEYEHHAFACGNQTVFNQASFTCAFIDEAIPCSNAKDFFYLNERLFQDKDTPILGDEEAQKAAEFYPARAAAAAAKA